jgi:protein phosphatase
MGTTVDALLLLPQGAVVAHVGDSRVYRWRNQTIEQLTFDHSLVWEVCVAFKLPFDQAPQDIPRNQITRSLGPTEKLKVDLEGPYPIEVGDIFLVCSDGLCGQINDREIGQVLGALSPEEATETLVNLANLRGGPDNITLIVAKATEMEDQNLPLSPGFSSSAWISLAVTAAMLVVMTLGILFDESRFFAWVGIISAILGLITFVWNAREFLFFFFFQHTSPDKLYGNGPYTSYSCPPGVEFTEKLASVLQQFRQVTQGNKWDIPWDKANVREQAALSAIRLEQYGTAIREYCLMINFLMQELKKQRPKK